MTKQPPGEEYMTIEQYVAERNRALTALDMAWSRKYSLPGMTDEELLIGLHKARYEARGIASGLRIASGRWLRERGYTRMHGLPWLPDGELP